ncbi:MAG: c-type cytochrome [Phycisphaerales bacterium]
MSAPASVIACVIVTTLTCAASAASADDAIPSFRGREFAAAPMTENPVLVRGGTRGVVWVIDRVDGEDRLRLLRDTDGDGRADAADTLVEHLIDVRGVVPIGERRALVLEPPYLLDVVDANADGRAERVRVVAGGLDHGVGLALGADGTIHVAGADVRLAWNGESVEAEPCATMKNATLVTDGGAGRPVIAIGSLVARESFRAPGDDGDGRADALRSFEPLGALRDGAPAAIAYCPDDRLGAAWDDATFCVLGNGREVVAIRPTIGSNHGAWGRSAAIGPIRVFQAAAADGRIESIDLSPNGEILAAIGSAGPTRGGRIVALAPSELASAARAAAATGTWASSADREAFIAGVRDGTIARADAMAKLGIAQRQSNFEAWTPDVLLVAARSGLLASADVAKAAKSGDAALRTTAMRIAAVWPVADEAQQWIARGLDDESVSVRLEALSAIARRANGATEWAALLARSRDASSGEPTTARAFAIAATNASLAPSETWSRLVREAWIDEQLARTDEAVARAIVDRSLPPDARSAADSAAIARLSAALRLNDRKPGRLALDREPAGFDAGKVASLDEAERRIMRRLQWPGRADAEMDPEPPASVADLVERGRRLFSNCLTCHGAAGRGQPGVYPPLAGSPYVLGDPERFAAIILHGLQGPVEVGSQKFSGTMPPPPALSSDADIAAVMTYVRQAFGNSAEPVGADLVARVRAANAARRTPWTIAELEAIGKR